MSAFLTYHHHLLPPGSAPAQVAATLRGHLVDQGWQVAAPTPTTLVLQPPVAEVTGNARAADVAVLTVGASSITLQSGMILRQAQAAVTDQGGTLRQVAAAAGAVVLMPLSVRTLTTDLTLGSAYFMTIHARTVQLAVQTDQGYYGPLIASWADHALAAASCPPGCVPVELLTGSLQAEPSGPSFTSESASLTLARGYGVIRGDAATTARATSPGTPPLESLSAPVDVCVTDVYHYSLRDGRASDVVIGFTPRGTRNHLPFAVGAVTTSLLSAELTESDGSVIATAMAPGFTWPDLSVQMRDAPDDGRLAFVGDLAGARSLAAPLAATDATVTLTTGAGLPQAGSVVIGTEVLEYSGRTGTVLTGVTRGQLGSAPAAAIAGAAVLPGQWYVRVNAAMLLAGPLRPSTSLGGVF